MALNTHCPYDDDDDDFEEEWEVLNTDTTTAEVEEVAEHFLPPIATADTADLETTESKETVTCNNDDNKVVHPLVKEEASTIDNRQDESESNISVSTVGRTGDVSSSMIVTGEIEDRPLADVNNHLNDLEMKEEDEEENASIASGRESNGDTNTHGEDESTPPPQSNNTNDPLLQNTWNFIDATFHDIDNQHQIRQRTRNSVNHINRSMQNLFVNIANETQNASAHVCHAASSAKESISRANTEYKLSEKVATAAVIGGATLLALGNPRAGVTALAVAGASLAVGEVISSNSEEARASRRREDYGLREGVHLD
jgi:hypothetical protein